MASDMTFNVFIIIGALAYAFTILFGTKLNKPFPYMVMDLFKEPLTKAIIYMLIFYVSHVNMPAALGLLIATLVVHLDYINIASKPI